MAAFDTIIKGGTVVDGTGMPRYVGDIGIRDGRIAAIDGLSTSDADRVIDATGLVVAPGFIDLHTHYDAQLFWDPHCTISGWHGVTSVVVGNCGFGFAPCRPADRDRSMLSMTRNEQISLEAMQIGLPWDWETFPEFLDSIERTPKGVNVLSYVPLSPVMVWAMGDYEVAKTRRPTPEEIKTIQAVIHEAMDAGACGWSVQRLGLKSFQPDYDGTPMVTDLMTDEEGYAFAEVLRQRGEGTIQLTYIPFDAEGGDDAFTALSRGLEWSEELAQISGRPILHNAVFAIDDQPAIHEFFIHWLARCHERGLPVYGQGETNRNFQQFNLASWTGFDIAPAWMEALMGTVEERLARLRHPEVRARMMAERPLLLALESGGMKADLFEVISVGDHPELGHHVGRTLGDIAADEGKDVLDVMIDLSIATHLEAEFRTPVARRPTAPGTAELIRSGKVIPGVSDGGAHTKYFVGGTYTTDFLTWMVRDTSAITLEEAHQALSALPARVAGFKDRGTLQEGMAADIVIYDLEALTIKPEALYETRADLPGGDWRRVRWADGYRWTIVNGEVTFEDGQATGTLSGRLLRHGRG